MQKTFKLECGEMGLRFLVIASLLCCVLKGQTFTSNLPIVLLTSRPGPTPIDSAWYDIYADMAVIDNGEGHRNSITDPPNNYKGGITIRVQGSSSVMWPKRSFRISTIDQNNANLNVPLMGLPPNEDWIFKASYQDKTFLRDPLTFFIANSMGHYSSRVKYFEMFINGEYRGVYQLQEKIRRNDYRVNIAKMSINDNSGDAVTGGYIISLDKFVPTDMGWYSKYHSNSTNDSANYFLYYYPKPDSITQPQKNYIKSFFDSFEDALASPNYTHPATGYRAYIDVTSFIDNFIINELSKNIDGFRASTFFSKDRNSNGGKLKAMPMWDYNLGYGKCGDNNAWNPAGWQFQQPVNINFVPWWWSRLMSDPTFVAELKCRYTMLRAGVLKEENLDRYIDGQVAIINEAQQRNFQRWPIMGKYVWPEPSPPPADYASEIGYLKYFLHARMQWMDNNIPGKCVVSNVDTAHKQLITDTYPNPFTDEVRIIFQVKEKSYVSIVIDDLMGNHVQVVREELMAAGSYVDLPSTATLSEGTYILKITAGDNIVRQKIVKIKQ